MQIKYINRSLSVYISNFEYKVSLIFTITFHILVYLKVSSFFSSSSSLSSFFSSSTICFTCSFDYVVFIVLSFLLNCSLFMSSDMICCHRGFTGSAVAVQAFLVHYEEGKS